MPKIFELVRKGRGQSLVELAAGLIILVPIMLILADMAFLIIATQINDAACRDAARAAGAGPPDKVLSSAKAAAEQTNTSGYIKEIKVDSAVTVPDPVPDPGPFGGAYSGSVVVKTHITVSLPAQVPFLPATTQPIVITAQEQFPITYVKPNTTTIP